MTREEWLNKVAQQMAPWFQAHGYKLPPFRVSIGFTSKGGKSRAIGQCWSPECSEDARAEIFLRPDLEDPMELAAVLAHELIHAAVGNEHGHKGPFRKVAMAIGLEGKMTATTAGEAFKRAALPILEAVGPMPHARLNFGGRSSGPKKQTTRMIKCECPECGYVARTTRTWLEEAGAPICPKDMVAMTPDLPQEEEPAGELEGAA